MIASRGAPQATGKRSSFDRENGGERTHHPCTIVQKNGNRDLSANRSRGPHEQGGQKTKPWRADLRPGPHS